MKKRITLVLLVGFIFWINAGCVPSFSSPSPVPQTQFSTKPPCSSIQRGIDFLAARFNSNLGLLNESPVVAPNKYWLTNDNALAAFALSKLGRSELAATLKSSLQHYGYETNGLIEVIWGTQVFFPPHAAEQVMISIQNGEEIWQEFRMGGKFEDWHEYADLGFLGALNEFRAGRISESHAIFSKALEKFKDQGFQDQAFKGLYETYKLALALYVGDTIQAPIPIKKMLQQILLAMQAENGGFYTHYRDIQHPEGDTNTETTAYALLAQNTVGCSIP
jgi:hypothetical protein